MPLGKRHEPLDGRDVLSLALVVHNIWDPRQATSHTKSGNPHPFRKHDVRATLSTKIFVRAARSWIPMDVTPIGHGAFPMASSTYSSFA